MRVARDIAALTIASVAILGLAACASSDAPKLSSAVGARSGSDPTDAPSETSDSTDKPSKPPGDQSGDLTADNFSSRLTAASKQAGSVTITADERTGAQVMTISADLVWTATSRNASMQMSSPDTGDIELREVDNMVYLTGVTDDGKFTKIDPSDPDTAGFAGILDPLDPIATMEAMDGAITSLKKVGSPVDTDGVKAQQYEVVIDRSKLSGTATDQLGLDSSRRSGELRYQYWVDQDDLMRKKVSETADTETTSMFSNWGEDLNIVAPNADQIANS